MSEVAITKIKIKIGKNEIEITPEEAAKLREALDKLLGASEQPVITIKEKEFVPYPVYPRWWDYWREPYYTPIIQPQPSWIVCGSNTPGTYTSPSVDVGGISVQYCGNMVT